jgi:hypothetical protein
MSLTDLKLISLEKKYFNILNDFLHIHLGELINQLYSQTNISLPTGGTVNFIQKGAQNIIEGLISKYISWNIASMQLASDSCYECGDAIIHIDVKTMKDTDSDIVRDVINVRKTQTSYDSSASHSVAGKDWLAQLRHYENHSYFGKIPNLTYIIQLVYTDTILCKEIILRSIPNGQLFSLMGGISILGAGKNNEKNPREDIRFNFKKILSTPGQDWRKNTVFLRM